MCREQIMFPTRPEKVASWAPDSWAPGPVVRGPTVRPEKVASWAPDSLAPDTDTPQLNNIPQLLAVYIQYKFIHIA